MLHSTISRYGIPTVEQENSYVDRLKQNANDTDALLRLCACTTKHFYKALKYQNPHDLQTGLMMCIYRAALKYDPDYGNRFVTFARAYIRQAFQHHKVENAIFPKLEQRFLQRKQDREGNAPITLSLDTSMTGANGDEYGWEIEDENQPDVIENMTVKVIAQIMQDFRGTLPTKKHQVTTFDMRIIGEHTLDQTSLVCGVSRERIRQIEVVLRRKMVVYAQKRLKIKTVKQ